jgi:hypothetical protein
VEAIELDAGMKVLLDGFDDARADERFGSVEQERGDAGQRDEDKNDRECGPLEPPVAAQK